MERSLEAIRYNNKKLQILNQLLLPEKFIYEHCNSSELGFHAIKSMKVRGAPAIAITAALSLACELEDVWKNYDLLFLKKFIFDKLDYLCTSRPTAVNLFKMAENFKYFLDKELHLNIKSSYELKESFQRLAENLFINDISDNKSIGQYGASCFQHLNSVNILTHCNTGSLATAGFGTALGIIRTLHLQNKLEKAYATETRPYNQGARLTAFELVFEKISATLITDSMAAFLMLKKRIDGVIVGADRVVANGDTANKIGTYQLAIVAKYHNVPFYVAAPTTSIDTSIHHGNEIIIEERPQNEMTSINGMRIAAEGIDVWNPSFDVTPNALITGIITEKGIISKNEEGKFKIIDFISKHNNENN